MSYEEREISIGEVKLLLEQGFDIEVDSPDGFIPITTFVDKGFWDEYILILDDGREVRVNENHLFETNEGWKYVKDIWLEQTAVGYEPYRYLCVDGWYEGRVKYTGVKIPIVDIQVDHENHRYYTNGVSSHNTGVGKSLFMCHCAASNLTKGLNVLYITLEMAEEKIAERIDANLLNVTVDELSMLPYDAYQKKIERVKGKTAGKLVIKEYPTSSAGSANFRHLLNELKIKKQFVPDIIYIDYLNICASSRFKHGSNVNSYTYVKAIAEELRGLAGEFNVPIVSATQTTRSGFSNTDLGLEDTSECLDPNSTVIKIDGTHVLLHTLKPGDRILGSNGFVSVMQVHHKQIKKMYKVTTKTGKQIICSADHVFPTALGRMSIKSGLSVGSKLRIKL